ncbi:QRFP-like peptide receptor [Actinia tenebrosa]|uniref:QRFP-like peptide receptor n=1 Tax=Actinia tenebrosa TaxID=6105 RepID=A0A6P8IKG9_ACTTE|nr:QRFP-like peptide receptor [Actinia tenebrosa]
MNFSANSTTNSTGLGPNCEVYTMTTFSKVSETIGYLLVLIFGVIGNTLVVAIVYRNRSMRTPANYFIANMAIADLMVPIFLVPKTLAHVYHGRNAWLIGGTFGEFLCKFVPFIYDVCLMVSIHSLVLVAVERFYAVMRPLRAAIRSTRRCIVIIVSIWLLAMLFHGFYFYVHRLFYLGKKAFCYITWEPLDYRQTVEKIHIAIMILFYAFPLLSITTLYCVIILKLKRQRIPGTRYGHMIINRQKRVVNTFRMVMTVVLAFFICWTPSIVFTLLCFHHWDWEVPCDILFHAQLVVYMMAFSNNAITPYIYFVFNENYKNGLKALLPWYEKARTVGYPRGHLSHSTNSSLRSTIMTTRISFKNSVEQIAEPSLMEQPSRIEPLSLDQKT